MNPKKAHIITVSIKIRVQGGCFHREHSPFAYEIIDEYMDSHPSNEYLFEEHESGPEILTYLKTIGGVLSFVGGVIQFITAIIKARTEGIIHGDTRKAPIELIVRTIDEKENVKEEKVLQIKTGQEISEALIQKALTTSINKMFMKKE
jgi:heme/copper-type cytochrome/quinol oxidase subunit 1